jgi:hypothetical protein
LYLQDQNDNHWGIRSGWSSGKDESDILLPDDGEEEEEEDEESSWIGIGLVMRGCQTAGLVLMGEACGGGLCIETSPELVVEGAGDVCMGEVP